MGRPMGRPGSGRQTIRLQQKRPHHNLRRAMGNGQRNEGLGVLTASKQYHPGPPSGHPHLMDHQNFNLPIQNPNIDVRKNRPDFQLINEALKRVSIKLFEFYSLRGFLTSRPLRVRWQCFVTTIESSRSSSSPTPTSITDSTFSSTSTSISAPFESGRASPVARD
ncbi:RNA-dependent RNA polymerase 1, partial [Fusarium oxysporum f. sp. albedinis]